MKSTRYFPFILLLIGVIAYVNSFGSAFIFDDTSTIIRNDRIRHILPQGKTEWLAPRGFADMTFAVNYAVGGLNPADYHAVNVLIHLMAGLLLYGLIRRTLLIPPVNECFALDAAHIAFVISAIWIVHPLTTSAVTYVSQRYECLMGMFYLLVLYSLLRGATSTRSALWYVAAILACALGMASKEVIGTAPFVALIYDRIFMASSLRQVFARRRALYAGLVVAALIPAVAAAILECAAPGSTGLLVYQGGISPLLYAFTQCGVILRYIRLSVLPASLCLDYSWLPVSQPSDAVPEAIVIGILCVLVLLLLRFRPRMGFLGIWFFAILAPTSSFIPRPDCAFEHRMYLSLAGVVALVVFGAYQLMRKQVRSWIMYLIACAVIACLAALSYDRNQDYRDEDVMWRDVIAKRPDNFRAYVPVISASLDEGRAKEAHQLAEIALRRMGDALHRGNGGRLAERALYWMPAIQNQMGRAFLIQGNNADAIRCFNGAILADNNKTIAWNNLGLALYLDGKTTDAMVALRHAVELDPSYGNPRFLIALMLTGQGKYKEAVGEFQKIPDSDSVSLPAKCEFAWLLATCPDDAIRDGNRAINMSEDVCRAAHNLSVRALDVLAASYAEVGRFDDAVKTARRALSLISTERVNASSVRLLSGAGGIEFSVLIADRTSEIPSRLKIYEKHQPFRTEMRNGEQQ